MGRSKQRPYRSIGVLGADRAEARRYKIDCNNHTFRFGTVKTLDLAHHERTDVFLKSSDY
jgi:hypothetical protein